MPSTRRSFFGHFAAGIAAARVVPALPAAPVLPVALLTPPLPTAPVYMAEPAFLDGMVCSMACNSFTGNYRDFDGFGNFKPGQK